MPSLLIISKFKYAHSVELLTAGYFFETLVFWLIELLKSKSTKLKLLLKR